MGARTRFALSAFLLVPAVASAHDFHSLGYAAAVFLAIHIAGVAPWWRAWRLPAIFAYLLSFPVVVIVGIWLVNTFALPAPLEILVAIVCAPALVSFVMWIYKRLRNHRGTGAGPLVLIVLISTACAPLSAAGATQQLVALPGHGQLELLVPASWQADVHKSPAPLPPTVVLRPSSGEPFQVLITVVWPPQVGAKVADVEAIRGEVTSAAKTAALNSVETKISLKELRGAVSHGYYFSATDRAPRPGEFKYLTQGIVHLDDINLAFTVLTNDGQDTAVTAALEVLRTASHVHAA